MKKTAFSLLSVAALVVALGSSAPAQGCMGGPGTLTVTPGTVLPGDTLTIEVAGLPNAFALVAIAENPGSTPIGGFGPIPSAELCLESPFLPFPLGFTGMDGSVDRSFTIPANAPLPGNLTLHLQGVGFGFSFTPPPMPGFSFSLDTTNTATLNL
jgi:hypothetical protein